MSSCSSKDCSTRNRLASTAACIPFRYSPEQTGRLVHCLLDSLYSPTYRSTWSPATWQGSALLAASLPSFLAILAWLSMAFRCEPTIAWRYGRSGLQLSVEVEWLVVYTCTNCLSSSLKHLTVVFSLSIRNGCHPIRNGDAFSADTFTESSTERFLKHCTIKAWVWLQGYGYKRRHSTGVVECMNVF